MVIIKFQFKEEIRRVTIDENALSYQQIKELAQSLFGTLPTSFFFKYTDDEGDLVSVSSG